MMADAPSIPLILAAAALLLVAHIVRAARWGLLFPPAFLTRRFNLLLGLGVGYAVNLIVPLRVGEIVRILFVHRRDGVRLSHAAATVFVERVVDLLSVAVILSAMLLADSDAAPLKWTTPALMVGTAAVALVAIGLVRRSLRVRRLVWLGASVFNDTIRIGIVDFFWSAAEILAGGTLLRWRFVSASLAMWGLYLTAYGMFAAAVDMAPSRILGTLLTQPQNALLQNVPRAGSGSVTPLLVLFAVLPILVILCYGAVRHQPRLAFALDTVRRRGKSGVGSPLVVRKRFEAVSTYDYFLASLFTGDQQLVSGFGLEAVDDCVIHKFFNGGSDAITALVGVGDRLLIRKFAVDGAAEKLKVQADWLRQRSNGELPLVTVTGAQELRRTFRYDMPLVTPSNDFYDVIHTSALSRSRALLRDVIARLVDFHALTEESEGPSGAIAAYLDTKATKNARTILAFARKMLPSETFQLNGKTCSFASWDRLLDPDWLARQVRHPRVACVHGDLTIENIIISPTREPGFYIIDPNPENIFDSPLIDWSKLMQSLHLGYETLNQGLSIDVSGGELHLTHMRTQAYADLHQVLESEARERLGADALREIYFHEIINYLRLTTYKIRQSSKRGLGFFACTTMLLDRYAERFG